MTLSSCIIHPSHPSIQPFLRPLLYLEVTNGDSEQGQHLFSFGREEINAQFSSFSNSGLRPIFRLQEELHVHTVPVRISSSCVGAAPLTSLQDEIQVQKLLIDLRVRWRPAAFLNLAPLLLSGCN